MFKTFFVQKSIDDSWTGGGYRINYDCVKTMDELINKFSEENKMKVEKVDYSSINENIQRGTTAVERIIWLVAGVSFKNIEKQE